MSDERGQALVEFALVLPVLLVLALAIGELSELGVARLALTHAAAEGARTIALTNDDRLGRASIAAAAAPLRPGGIDISIEPPAERRGADPRGTLVSVHLRYAVAVPFAFSSPLVVRGDAARSMEWTP